MECPVCSLRHSPRCALVPHTWPLEPLLDLLGQRSAPRTFLASGAEIQRAADEGLSDVMADRWAIRAGVHPAQVWPGWCDAALTVVDRQMLEGGWRHVWLASEPVETATEVAA